jgi:hypothetical protein
MYGTLFNAQSSPDLKLIKNFQNIMMKNQIF